MGLKKKSLIGNDSGLPPSNARSVHREDIVNEPLDRALRSAEDRVRREAARQIAQHPEHLGVLIQALETETVHAVRTAMFDSLDILGRAFGAEVVAGLIPFLRSEETPLRNGVIEILASLPEAMAPHIEALLADEDSDVRIFALDIIGDLAHSKAPAWLLAVVEQEKHVNVLAAAIDRLAEIGSEEMVQALVSVKKRFANEPYIGFAADVAIGRIRGSNT